MAPSIDLKSYSEGAFKTAKQSHSHAISGGDRTTRPDSIVVNWAGLHGDLILDLCPPLEGIEVLEGSLTVDTIIKYDASGIQSGEEVLAGGEHLLEKYRVDIRDNKIPRPDGEEDCPTLPFMAPKLIGRRGE